MKKILVALVAAGVLSFAASSPAVAQGDTVIIKVPFQFIAGDRVLPAGSYQIASLTPGWGIVRITNLDVKSDASAAFIPTEGDGNVALQTDKDPHAKFMNYHGQYFLQGFVVPGRAARRVVITEAMAERTLAKLNLANAEPANVVK